MASFCACTENNESKQEAVQVEATKVEEKSVAQTKSSETIVEKATVTTLMSRVFEGRHPEETIKAKMDSAMTLHNLPINDLNYNKSASTLVTLKRESKKGVTEMDILNHMLESTKGTTTISFDDQARISAALLEKKKN